MKCGHVSPSAHDKAVNYPTHSLVGWWSAEGGGGGKGCVHCCSETKWSRSAPWNRFLIIGGWRFNLVKNADIMKRQLDLRGVGRGGEARTCQVVE